MKTTIKSFNLILICLLFMAIAIATGKDPEPSEMCQTPQKDQICESECDAMDKFFVGYGDNCECLCSDEPTPSDDNPPIDETPDGN